MEEEYNNWEVRFENGASIVLQAKNAVEAARCAPENILRCVPKNMRDQPLVRVTIARKGANCCHLCGRARHEIPNKNLQSINLHFGCNAILCNACIACVIGDAKEGEYFG